MGTHAHALARIGDRCVQRGQDYIVLGSDSGRIVILEYHQAKNEFVKVHEETFGKSGIRRIVPGQMLAGDPKGRALMIGACAQASERGVQVRHLQTLTNWWTLQCAWHCAAAVEKQKFVYIMNRDSNANLTISSPLEAHKSHTLVYSCTVRSRCRLMNEGILRDLTSRGPPLLHGWRGRAWMSGTRTPSLRAWKWTTRRSTVTRPAKRSRRRRRCAFDDNSSTSVPGARLTIILAHECQYPPLASCSHTTSWTWA